MTAAVLPDGFVGLWQLQPGQSTYQFGLPPVAGSYRIGWDAGAGVAALESRIRLRSGRVHALQVQGRIDGQPHPLTGSRIADAVSLWLDAPDLLRSAGWQAGIRIQWAERRLLGDRLQITVHGRLAGGRDYTNTDRYNRVAE